MDEREELFVAEENFAEDYEAVRDRQSDQLFRLLEEKKFKQLQSELEEIEEFDVAEFLTELPEMEMARVFRMLSKEKGAEVFSELDIPEQEYIINFITDAELSCIIEEMYVDDAVDLMEELPANVVKRVMRAATPETRRLINQYLKYPENSAGSIMTAEFIDLKKYMSVRESFARIRRIGADKETIYTCFVTSADRKLEGVVTIKDLIMADEDEAIENIMDDNVIFAVTTDDQEEVSGLFTDYDLLTIPVVDKEHRLVGIVTVDDVMDVIEQETTEDFEKMAAMAPSDKPYSRTGPLEMWKNRFPWLLFLMLSATFTSIIINAFEGALAAQAALIGFIPMLTGTGGNSGSQSSTAVIRSLSLGDSEPKDVLMIIWKEVRVAVLCGLALALVNFLKMLFVDKLVLGNEGVTLMVAATVSVTMIFVVIFAKAVGCTLPILAERLGVDPAVMASPLIATITDSVSLLIYFTVATLFLGL